MNSDDALQQFSRQHLKILTSESCTRDDIKKLVREFFYVKHAKRFGTPSIKEVQVAIIGLMRKNGVPTASILTTMRTAPHFGEMPDGVRQQILEDLSRKEHASALSPEEIGAIKQVGAYRALEQTLGDQIESQKQAELQALEKQIESKKQEYDSLPSLLDQAPVGEPDFQPRAEESRPWWERFYLKSDPFPRKDGLSAIDEDLYEAVISKTQPFVETIANLERNPSALFYTGHLLVGGYGYGKTTFIDYLSHRLVNMGVLPVRITCTRCSADASGFADSFFHRLRKELFDELSRMTHVDSHKLAGLEIEDQVIELFKLLAERKKGTVIFIDDYHKYASHFAQIYEFLGTLQVLKDSLTRKEIPSGFIVSGIPDWKKELERNSQLSGFLDGVPIEMPDVTAELVCEVFNKRIKAYCYEGTPRFIKSDFVQQLVREFEGKAGFRDYLGKIVRELSHDNDAIVDSPIEIQTEQLDAVRNLLEGDAQVKAGLTRLVFSTAFQRFNQEQVGKTLELLVHIGIQGGITETDKLFASNRFYFQTLKQFGLIQKQRTEFGALSWGLHSRFRRAVETIHAKLGFGIQDYLLKLYAYKSRDSATRSNIAPDAELLELKQFFGNPDLKLADSVTQNIALGLRVLESLSAKDRSRRREANDLESAYAAVAAFSEAMFTLDGAARLYARVSLADLASQWELHPDCDEAFSEAFARRGDYLNEKSPHRLILAVTPMKEAAMLAAKALRRLLEHQALSADISLLHRPLDHADDEIRLFEFVLERKYSTRSEDHFEYVRKVTDHLERRFRAFFYVTGNLVFGQNYIEQCPKHVVSYAYKSMETRVTYGSVENRFDGLTRSQYRQIIGENNPYKEHVVDRLGLAWKSDDWKLFGELFAETNIDASHQQVNAYHVTQRSRYLRYCAMIEEITAAMNTMLASLIDRNVFLCAVVSGTRKVEEVLFRFDFRVHKGKEIDGRVFSEWPKYLSTIPNSVDHTLMQSNYDRVYQRLNDKLEHSPNGLVVIDLLNVEYLVDHYRVPFIDIVCALSFIAHVDRSLKVFRWMGSSVVIRRGSI